MTLAALATTASAQDVTVYGVIDQSVQSYDNGSTTLTRIKDGVLQTSRLGFRGSEDLGGGLKANFLLEGMITASTGTVGTSTTNQFFNRHSWVGLSGDFGEVRLGRGDVTGAQDVDFYTSQFYNLGFIGSSGTNSVELGNDQNNVVQYRTPTFGGFVAHLGYASGNGNTSTTEQNADQQSIYVGYRSGNLGLHSGWQKNDGATSVEQRDFWAVGASYDFGFASVGLAHAAGDTSTTGDVDSKATTASVKVPMAAGIDFHASYQQADDGELANSKGKAYNVGLVKNLSKRTKLYAIYTTVDNDSNAKFANVVTSAPATGGVDTKAYNFGISHAF